jgi:hypothetical protein
MIVRLLLFSVFGLVLTGCGGGTAVSRVAGEVTYNGSPVQAGMVSFESIDGSAAPVSAPILGGAYETSEDAKLTPGRYRLRISAPDTAAMGASAQAGPHDAVQFVPLLPRTWNVNSQLEVELSEGRNIVNIRGQQDQLPEAVIEPS